MVSMSSIDSTPAVPAVASPTSLGRPLPQVRLAFEMEPGVQYVFQNFSRSAAEYFWPRKAVTACLLFAALPLTLKPIEYSVRRVFGTLITLGSSVASTALRLTIITPGTCTVGETKSIAAATRDGRWYGSRRRWTVLPLPCVESARLELQTLGSRTQGHLLSRVGLGWHTLGKWCRQQATRVRTLAGPYDLAWWSCM